MPNSYQTKHTETKPKLNANNFMTKNKQFRDTFENTNRRQVFSTFIECSQMTGVFYHIVIHGLGFFVGFKI